MISTILARAISFLIVDFWLVYVVDLMLITTLVAMLTEKGVACDVCVTLLGIYAVDDAKILPTTASVWSGGASTLAGV